jgi:hypothetical protein
MAVPSLAAARVKFPTGHTAYSGNEMSSDYSQVQANIDRLKAYYASLENQPGQYKAFEGDKYHKVTSGQPGGVQITRSTTTPEYEQYLKDSADYYYHQRLKAGWTGQNALTAPDGSTGGAHGYGYGKYTNPWAHRSTSDFYNHNYKSTGGSQPQQPPPQQPPPQQPPPQQPPPAQTQPPQPGMPPQQPFPGGGVGWGGYGPYGPPPGLSWPSGGYAQPSGGGGMPGMGGMQGGGFNPFSGGLPPINYGSSPYQQMYNANIGFWG